MIPLRSLSEIDIEIKRQKDDYDFHSPKNAERKLKIHQVPKEMLERMLEEEHDEQWERYIKQEIRARRKNCTN